MVVTASSACADLLSRPLRFLVSAGETSGDLHAATVVAALKQRFPDSEIAGIAGVVMQREGCHPICPMRELNVMGVGDVLRSLSRIRRVEASLLSWVAEARPAVAVLVDFSSFHMRLGRKLRAMGVPVVHFIAPKLWAWGRWRARKLAQSQDRLACILPFEPAWFRAQSIEHAEYVGNPSAVGCVGGWSRQALCQRLEIDAARPLLALLPGSRRQELVTHVPILAAVLQRVRRQLPDVAVVLPLAPDVDQQLLQPLQAQGALPISRLEEGFALRADAAVAVSGTATLELALWDTPTVLIYKAAPLMYFLASRLVQLRCAGLANIILDDQPVMPEFIQDACQPDRITAALLPLLQDDEATRQQRQAFGELRQRLGGREPANGVVAMVESLM